MMIRDIQQTDQQCTRLGLRDFVRHSHLRPFLICAAVLFASGVTVQGVYGLDDESDKARDAAIAKGLAFLKTSQRDDGTFSPEVGPGLTALAISAAIRCGQPLDDPLVAKGLAALEGYVKPDGGIYGGDRLKNYETCISVMCFADANKDGRYDEILANAGKYLKGLQYGATGEVDESDVWYGGVGYGGPQRPDLSNTAYMIDALIATGEDNDSEAIQRALNFVTRCQNLANDDTAANSIAARINDGGFRYEMPRDESGVKEEDLTGGLRSYGSMTYAGLKSMVYAGLTEDDPRVEAALKWLQENYSVKEHAGQGDAGLYYYYNLMSSALEAAKLAELKGADGSSHMWREELAIELASRQNENGSWTNSNARWLENNADLATSFALMALAACK
jgi:squalene-hopene/tetraprenyl-beta-curcumene cyclase